jgi:hypothetical protein
MTRRSSDDLRDELAAAMAEASFHKPNDHWGQLAEVALAVVNDSAEFAASLRANAGAQHRVDGVREEQSGVDLEVT